MGSALLLTAFIDKDPLEYQTFSAPSPSNSDRTSVFLFCDFDFSFGTIRDSFLLPYSDSINRISRFDCSIYDPSYYRLGRPGRSYSPISYSTTAAAPTGAPNYTIANPTYGIALKLPVEFKLWRPASLPTPAPAYLCARYQTSCCAEGEGGEGLNGQTRSLTSRHAGRRYGQC